jgi:hypothetical protein
MFYARFGPSLRHPLARFVGGILGIVVVLGVLALGLFAFAAVVAIGAVWMVINMFRKPRMPRPPASAEAPAASPGVIDGEFTVIRETPNHSNIPR